MNPPSIVLALMLMMTAAPAAAQEAFLPPPEVVDIALEDHPSLLAASERVRAAEAAARGLEASPYEFQVTGGYARRTVTRDGAYSDFDGAISRGIRLPGKAALDRRAGSLGVVVAELRLEEARHEAALMLADLWYDWIAAASEAQVEAQALDGHERELASVRRRAELNDASLLDVDKARVALESSRAALAGARGRASIARAHLASQFPALPLPAAAPVLPAPRLDAAQARGWRDLSIERNHEFKAALAETDRQKALAERARLDRRPDPSLGVRMFSERGGAEWGAGVTASIPLGGARRRAGVDQQLAESRAAAADVGVIAHTMRAEAEANVLAAESAVESWSITRSALESAREAARRLRVGYDMGASDLAEILYAERQANEAARAEAAQRVLASRAITKLQIDAHVLWIRPHADEPES